MNLLAFLMIAGGMMLVLVAPMIQASDVTRRMFIGVSMAMRSIYRPRMDEHPFGDLLIEIDERARSERGQHARPAPDRRIGR